MSMFISVFLLFVMKMLADSRQHPGLFSFKNYQLMRVTDSLFRRSGRAVAKPISVNLRKDSFVVAQ